jgi:uncharacterized damage-inducible protein DinB
MNEPTKLPIPWMERDWSRWSQSVESHLLLDRLNDFPHVVADLILHLDQKELQKRDEKAWSIQEHVGHLLAMESLWIARLDDFVLNRSVLRPWNGHNNDVRAAQFNQQKIKAMCRDFVEVRSAMVTFTKDLMQTGQSFVAFHEGQNRDFSLNDQVAFIAEHDAHHLQIIQYLIHANK